MSIHEYFIRTIQWAQISTVHFIAQWVLVSSSNCDIKHTNISVILLCTITLCKTPYRMIMDIAISLHLYNFMPTYYAFCTSFPLSLHLLPLHTHTHTHTHTHHTQHMQKKPRCLIICGLLITMIGCALIGPAKFISTP